MSKELLEKLRRSYEANEFVKYNHIVIDDIEVSGATAHIDIVPETLNVLGVAHGGAHFSLAFMQDFGGTLVWLSASYVRGILCQVAKENCS